MTTRCVTIGVFGLSCLISATSPFVQTAHAQPTSCDREIASQEAALGRFIIDARRESMDFILDDVRRSALSGLRARLAGDPTFDALEEVRQRWEDYTGFIENAKSLPALFDQISQCMAAGMVGCLNELTERNLETDRLLDRVSEATNAWIDSLKNASISNAAARVERASKVVENLITEAGNLATGALSGAMQNCFGDFERQVEARRDPVDTASPPPPPAPQPPAPPVDLGGNSGDEPAETGGIGGAIKTGLLLGGVGVAIGVAADAYRQLRELETGGTGCISSRNCVVNSFGGGCRCTELTNGPCGFSGAGGVNASYPCQSGLQCTNGRCEDPRRSDARCP